MKLDLEFDDEMPLAYACCHKNRVDDDCVFDAVIIGKSGNVTGNGLCLAHLQELKNKTWNAAMIPKNITGTLRDAVIAEFYRVFPEPESERLVPCPVCGGEPVYRVEYQDYCCYHGDNGLISRIHTTGFKPEPLARAAWNSMRKPVVSAADAPEWLPDYARTAKFNACLYTSCGVRFGCASITEHQLRAMLARIEQEKAKP